MNVLHLPFSPSASFCDFTTVYNSFLFLKVFSSSQLLCKDAHKCHGKLTEYTVKLAILKVLTNIQRKQTEGIICKYLWGEILAPLKSVGVVTDFSELQFHPWCLSHTLFVDFVTVVGKTFSDSNEFLINSEIQWYQHNI